MGLQILKKKKNGRHFRFSAVLILLADDLVFSQSLPKSSLTYKSLVIATSGSLKKMKILEIGKRHQVLQNQSTICLHQIQSLHLYLLQKRRFNQSSRPNQFFVHSWN